MDYFGEKLVKLVPHEFIARSQSEFLKTTKENLKANEFVVISDFAENYTFVIQDEVQARHWNQEQCTLHPFSIYFKEGNELRTTSFVVIAESLEHNITSVYLFQTKLFDFLREKFRTIKKIFFFSDGAAGQYKNKKNFLNLYEMRETHEFQAEWHFFATHHGKSPCDALGGTIKRMATKASLQRALDDQILSAKKLYDFLREDRTIINTVFCTQNEHNDMAEQLKNKYIKVKTISGTRDFHGFIPSSVNFTINCKRISSSKSYRTAKLC